MVDSEKSLFWADQLAEEIIKRMHREGSEGGASGESGVGNVKCQQTPSGGKHIGNLNDVLRAYFPYKSVVDAGEKISFVHTTDDRDPLKDVPARIADLQAQWHSSKDFPDIQNHLGKPLCRVPDPFGCCKSWSQHFTKVWMDGVESLDVHPMLYSVNDLYEQGRFEPYVRQVFEKRVEVSKIVAEFQESKEPNYLPFDAICPSCGQLANIDSFDLDNKTVHFVCGGKSIKKKKTEGCGFEGVVPWREGKLQWRFEWPALWCIFNTTYEPFGKDHAEGSWKSGVEIMKRVFDREPPIPFVYEFFLVNGEKMSASKGNVYVVQDMLKIIEREVFLFFYTKRPEKQRDLELSRIWQLADEFDYTERVYYGLEKDRTDNREENSKRMYLATVPKPSEKCPQRVSYSFCASLAQLFDDETALRKLETLGHLNKPSKEDLARTKKRLALARNWIALYAPPEAKVAITPDSSQYEKLGEKQREALNEFAAVFPTLSQDKQAEKIKEICSAHELHISDFFKAAYLVLIARERGPKLIPFINALDKILVQEKFEGKK